MQLAYEGDKITRGGGRLIVFSLFEKLLKLKQNRG